MKKKNSLIYLLISVVFLVGVFAWLMLQWKGPEISMLGTVAPEEFAGLSPVFPGNTERFLDDKNTWQKESFQPVFENFVSVDPSTNYLEVSYIDDTDGKTKKAKIYLEGQVTYYDKTGVMVVTDSVVLKDELVKGEQFGVEYLSMFPDDLTAKTPYCLEKSIPTMNIECRLAYQKQKDGKKADGVFYAFTVYRVLKK